MAHIVQGPEGFDDLAVDLVLLQFLLGDGQGDREHAQAGGDIGRVGFGITRDFSYPDILQGILATYQSTTAKKLREALASRSRFYRCRISRMPQATPSSSLERVT